MSSDFIPAADASLLPSGPLASILIGILFGVVAYLYMLYKDSTRKPPPPPRELPTDLKLTHQELKKYNGETPGVPIYIAIKGKIYDVGLTNTHYGPGGSYHVFAGREPNRGLAKMSTDEKDAIPSTEGLTRPEIDALNNWSEFFINKYQCVGEVVASK
eukprot:TRINITY_DN2962_c0_g2_i1.p1 TRINITY_DN2962_c0_g2~~TRINITY_DN2962_c0_g2_i1.p1  ORF type:complete len:158 (-),score=36.42 TRINITY_DN2962_c0_g2_i1:326-799(-)